MDQTYLYAVLIQRPEPTVSLLNLQGRSHQKLLCAPLLYAIPPGRLGLPDASPAFAILLQKARLKPLSNSYISTTPFILLELALASLNTATTRYTLLVA